MGLKRALFVGDNKVKIFHIWPLGAERGITALIRKSAESP